MVILLLACADGSGPDRPGVDTSIEADTDTDTDADTDSDADTDADTDTDTDTDTEVIPDADGDGYETTAVGGDDCDDTDARVHPGATEYCDGLDQDCDGGPVAPGVCGSAVSPEATVTWVAERAVDGSGGYGMIGDVTGDGSDDLMWGFAPFGGVTIIDGGTLPSTPVVVPEQAWIYGELDSGGMFGGEALDIGDVDGDGVRDLGFVSHAWGGGIYVHLGPFTEGEVFSIALEQDLLWTGFPQDPESWAVTVVGGEDFDGDGGADVVLSSNTLEGIGYDTDVHFSGIWDDHCPLGDHGGDGRPDLLGDVDGDGVRDLNIYAGRPFIVSGADLRSSCGAPWEDVAIGALEDGDTTSRVNGSWASIDDATGDGLDDVVAGAARSSSVGSYHGEVYFYSGAELRGEVLIADAVGSYVGDADMARIGTAIFPVHYDGDETLDYVISGAAGEEGHFGVIRGGAIPPLRTLLPVDRVRLGDGVSTLRPGDFDGDGHADLWFLDLETVGLTRLGILRGFDVPWDDPIYW